MIEPLVGRNIPPRIQFEITHRCNQNCPLCDHRISSSWYPGMTKAQYRHVISCLDTSQFKVADLIGGEPLVHPLFHWFAMQMLKDFEGAGTRIRVRTNGRLVLQFKRDYPGVFKHLSWIVQEYPGFNDDVLPQIAELPIVKIIKYTPFWDPYRDPNLDEATARKVRPQCNHHVRIIGDRLYNCCLAEGVERYYHTEPVHVRMSSNWREDWAKLETWKACQHCFRAIDWFDEQGNKRHRH